MICFPPTVSPQNIQQRWLPSIDGALSPGQSANCLAFALAGAGKFTFFTDAEFMAAVREHHRAIAKVGVEQTVDSFLTN